jgi:hypothetical protein
VAPSIAAAGPIPRPGPNPLGQDADAAVLRSCTCAGIARFWEARSGDDVSELQNQMQILDTVWIARSANDALNAIVLVNLSFSVFVNVRATFDI